MNWRFVVTGGPGGGKSTLLGLIGGVLVPQRGSVRLLGTDLAALSPSGRDRFRGEHLGFIFQMFNLIPYLGVLVIGFALWFAYGIALRNLAIVFPNVIAFVVGATTIAVARHYRRMNA